MTEPKASGSARASVKAPVPKAAPGDYNSIAAQYARAKALKDEEDRARLEGGKGKSKAEELRASGKPKTILEKLNEGKAKRFRVEWYWVVVFFVWLL
jgi:phosphatidylinositol glycan class O